MLARTLLLIFICGISTAVMAAEPELAARLLVSNPAPFVGEEIDLLLEISYRGRPDGRTLFNWPELDRFVSADPQSVRSHSARDDRNRLIETVSRRIRPLQPGTIQLRGAAVTSGTTRLALGPLTLRVQPLPATGRPEGFDGRIGTYQLKLDADGTGPRAIRLQVGDSTLLSPLPVIAASIGPGEQLQRLDTQTTRSTRGGRTHSLSFFYQPAGTGQNTVRFSFPAFDPQQKSYYLAATGPPPRSTPWLLAWSAAALLLLLVAGLVLLVRRRRPRTIEGCLHRLCRRPVAGLSREQIRGVLQSRLDQQGLDALQQYWKNRDACRFNRQRLVEPADTTVALKGLRRILWKAIDKQQDIP